MVGTDTTPMFQESSVVFPYKHSTGQTIGRFLAGLKEQKAVWGQRVSGQGVVVPPSATPRWTARAAASGWKSRRPASSPRSPSCTSRSRAAPVRRPFAFVLVRLDGADTALAHVVKDGLERLRVGSRVEAVWAPDDERAGNDPRHRLLPGVG